MPDLQLADEASRLVTYLRSADLSLITANPVLPGRSAPNCRRWPAAAR